MLRPVVKTECSHHLLLLQGVMQGRDRIKPAAQQDDDLHRRPVFAFRSS